MPTGMVCLGSFCSTIHSQPSFGCQTWSPSRTCWYREEFMELIKRPGSAAAKYLQIITPPPPYLTVDMRRYICSVWFYPNMPLCIMAKQLYFGLVFPKDSGSFRHNFANLGCYGLIGEKGAFSWLPFHNTMKSIVVQSFRSCGVMNYNLLLTEACRSLDVALGFFAICQNILQPGLGVNLLGRPLLG